MFGKGADITVGICESERREIRLGKHSSWWVRWLTVVMTVAMLAGCQGTSEDNGKPVSTGDVSVTSGDDTVSEEDFAEFVDPNAMSFSQIGETLNELGVPVDGETLAKAEASWNELGQEELEAYNKVGRVLALMGKGSYDKKTKTFTPSSDKVFAFEMENGASDRSLKNFLEGVNAISGGAVKITNVKLSSLSDKEKKSEVYQRTVQFKLNGKKCSYKAEFFYNWFDVSLISYINGVLEQQGDVNRLYYMDDNSTCEMFYCSSEWAEAFFEKTGCELMTEMR